MKNRNGYARTASQPNRANEPGKQSGQAERNRRRLFAGGRGTWGEIQNDRGLPLPEVLPAPEVRGHCDGRRRGPAAVSVRIVRREAGGVRPGHGRVRDGVHVLRRFSRPVFAPVGRPRRTGGRRWR